MTLENRREDRSDAVDIRIDRERQVKERGAEAFEKAPTEKKIRFVEFLLKNETEPAKRLKLQSFLDHLADKKYAESRGDGADSDSFLPDGKSVRVENGEIVIGGNEREPEKFDSSRLVAKITDDARNLSQFKKIEPFLKTFFREGIPLTRESFEDVSISLNYALKALSDELEPTLLKNRTNGNRIPGMRNIDLYDPETKDPAALDFRKIVSSLNKKYFDESPSPFRMRP